MSLIKVLDDQWADMAQTLDELLLDLRQVALQERAEVAGGTPTYADLASLPDGHLGQVATVNDAGSGSPGFCWHDGTTWQVIS